METLSINCDSTLLDKIGEFSLSEKQIQIFTGLSWENLLEIKDLMTLFRNSQSRSVIQALVVFLFKLRSGNSNTLSASILNIDNEQLISEYSKTLFIGTPLKCQHLVYWDFEGLPTTTFSLMVGVPPRFHLTPLHVTMYKEWWLEEKQNVPINEVARSR